ncbi:MAG: Uma2 family endonuclease [Verrucomicrobia bacterium]|nr:Uma2 family endonuclease [Verrucomicrobiota bacterium]
MTAQNPIHLDEFSEPQPGLMLVTEETVGWTIRGRFAVPPLGGPNRLKPGLQTPTCRSSNGLVNKPEPDDYASRHPQPKDVFLLIEVAQTSLGYDRDRKLPGYGRAGVSEVWIVNLTGRTIEVYREPHFAGYGSTVALRTGDKVTPLAFPDAGIDVAELLWASK